MPPQQPDGYTFVNMLTVPTVDYMKVRPPETDQEQAPWLFTLEMGKMMATLRHWTESDPETWTGGMDMSDKAGRWLATMGHAQFARLFPDRLRGIPMSYPERPYPSDHMVVRLRLCNWANPWTRPLSDLPYAPCYVDRLISGTMLRMSMEENR